MGALVGRVAIITGAGRGLGREHALLFAAEGAKVFICGHEEAALTEALADIREVGTGDGMAIDLAGPGAVERFVAAGEAAIGLAIVVVYFRNRGSIEVDDINLMRG